MTAIYNNIVIPTPRSSTEIDLLVVTDSCIFVIECKNWAGTIFANEDVYNNWVQYHRSGKTKQYYSPIKQNAMHISVLQRYLGIPATSFVSLVIFSDKAKLRGLPSLDHNVYVGDLTGALRRIPSELKCRQERIAGIDLARCKLDQLQQRSEYKGREHRVRMASRYNVSAGGTNQS